MNRILLSIIMSVVLLFGSFGMAFGADVTISAASDFFDMPDNWSTAALNKAVENGLLTGYAEDGKKLIKAGNSLTRAEMAAVVNRTFASVKMSDLSEVNDVSPSAWYADDMAKAVKMGTFSYDTKMRPGDKITRQEAFTVLARAFKLVGTDAEHTVLDVFSDKDEIATWALNSLDGMAEAGYIQGSGGALKPTDTITRAEFATVMDNLVKDYIDVAGDVTEVVAKGNVIVRTPGVVLKDVTVNGDLVIADGVGEGDLTLDNVKVQGRMVVRGGGIDSIIIKGGSDIGRVIVAKVDGEVRIFATDGADVDVIYVDDGSDDVIVEGKVSNLEVAGGGVTVYAKDADVNNATVSGDNSKVVVGDGSKVKNGNITGNFSAIVADKGGSVDKVAVSGSDASVEGEGEVKEVEVKEGGNGASINTPNTKTVVDKDVEGVKASGTSVEGGQTATNNATGTDATVADTPTRPSTPSTPQISAITMTTVVVVVSDDEEEVIENYDLNALPYGAKVTVTLETDGAEIYYTTDDSTPTVESAEYTEPFTVEADSEDAVTKTIKVLATKDGYRNRAGEFTIKFKPKYFTLTFDITVVDDEGKERVLATDAGAEPNITLFGKDWEDYSDEEINKIDDVTYKLETDKWYGYTITNNSGYDQVEGQVIGPDDIGDWRTLAITLVKVNYPAPPVIKYCSAEKVLTIKISKLLHEQENVKVGLPIYTGGGWPWASSQPLLDTMSEEEENGNTVLWFIGDTTEEEGVLTISGVVGEDLPYGSLRITLPDYGYTIDNPLPVLDMNPDVGIRLGGAISLEGVPVAGQTLKATNLKPSEASETVKYQWQKADTEDGEYVDIAGETAKTYVVNEGYVDKWIRVKATSKPTDDYHWGTAYSDPMEIVDYYVTPMMLPPWMGGSIIRVGEEIKVYTGGVNNLRADDLRIMLWAKELGSVQEAKGAYYDDERVFSSRIADLKAGGMDINEENDGVFIITITEDFIEMLEAGTRYGDDSSFETGEYTWKSSDQTTWIITPETEGELWEDYNTWDGDKVEETFFVYTLSR